MSSKKELNPCTLSHLQSVTRKRQGESKVGEHVAAAGAKWRQALEQHRGEFVLVGIPEDIGVRANLGRPGAHSAFSAALVAILNQQQNVFLDARQMLVLGEVECSDLMKKAEKIKPTAKNGLSQLRELVAVLDERVTNVMSAVFEAGKTPLVIGGGHNNAYGIIRAFSQHRGKPVSVINCDPHLDFRPREGRHSGNSFSYAFYDGFIDRYAVVGMHEQYNSAFSVSEFAAHPGRLWYQSFESIFVREEITFDKAVSDGLGFVKQKEFGVEFDIDSVTDMPSSARTSSGISSLQARQFVFRCGSDPACAYLHIAEAAPVLAHIRADRKTGKFIAYLVSDFIKGRSRVKQQ